MIRGNLFNTRQKRWMAFKKTQKKRVQVKNCGMFTLPPFLFVFSYQGEPGLHGVKGMRGEPGHKGDRGPLGLPVSTAVHHGISPPAEPCPLFP